MVAQLSTSSTDKQPAMSRTFMLPLLLLLLSYGTTAWPQGSLWEQPGDIEIHIDPLSTIDQHFMGEQRAKVDNLAGRLGRRLTGNRDRDIETLQMILDRNFISRDDTLSLQAMGISLGDLIAKELRMNWVVYQDRAGRSRALQYRNEPIYLFPITMISRRYEAGNNRPITDIYNEVVTATRKKLPGASWWQ